MQVRLLKAEKVPPTVAIARRIAEVCGYLNDELVADFDPKDELAGVVQGLGLGGKIAIAWQPSKQKGCLEFKIGADAMVSQNMNNIVPISELYEKGRRMAWAEKVGNVILSIIRHGQHGTAPGLENASPLDDADFNLTAMQKHAIRNQMTRKDN